MFPLRNAIPWRRTISANIVTGVDVDKKEEITQFLESVSLLLGFAHMSIAMILDKPDAELRDQLLVLKQELDKRVSKLYQGLDNLVSKPYYDKKFDS